MQHLLRYSGSAPTLLARFLPAPLSRERCHSFSLFPPFRLGRFSFSFRRLPVCSLARSLVRLFVRAFVRSFSKLSQVHASPPSYIQQTPSIYSFELDGSKGKVAGCRCVNFSNAELSTSHLLLSHATSRLLRNSPASSSRC